MKKANPENVLMKYLAKKVAAAHLAKTKKVNG